jgi:hypothetical protein
MFSFGTCLPYTVSNAKLISPTVALAAAASTAISSRLPFPDLADSVSLLSNYLTFSLSLAFLVELIRSICYYLTFELSI